MVKIVKDLFIESINNQIIKILKQSEGWYFGYDSTKRINYNDQGLALRTFNDEKNPKLYDKYQSLNLFAFMVVELVTKQLKIPYKSIKRVNYNFYHTLSEGDYHIDTNTPKCVSILYNLNKNNGYTEINGQKYLSDQSVAYVFDSDTKHRGVGSKTELRYNLNIILQT